MKKSTFLFSVMLGLICITGMASRTGFDSPFIPDFSEFSFYPVDDTWGIVWRKGPVNDLSGADLERYRINLELDNPADRDYNFRLQVVSNSTIIGLIHVSFQKGSTEPYTTYYRNEGAKQTPDGTRTLHNGLFWLGCTTPKGKLRGNSGKVNNVMGNVFLRIASQQTRATRAHMIVCGE